MKELQDIQEARDAAHECEHGRLPHDTTEPCGCWPQESIPYADNEAGRAARALGFLPPRTTAEANRQREAIIDYMED